MVPFTGLATAIIASQPNVFLTMYFVFFNFLFLNNFSVV